MHGADVPEMTKKAGCESCLCFVPAICCKDRTQTIVCSGSIVFADGHATYLAADGFGQFVPEHHDAGILVGRGALLDIGLDFFFQFLLVYVITCS